MPFYRFQIEVPLPQQRVMERIRSLARERPSFWQLFSEQMKPRDASLPPFIGSVDGDSFNMHRDIRYRNSFLPMIRGHLLPTSSGTQLDVTMYLQPFVAAFMTFWLGSTGFAAITIGKAAFTPSAMFLFGVVMMCGGFFYEAFKAKQMLTDAVSDPGIIRRQ